VSKKSRGSGCLFPGMARETKGKFSPRGRVGRGGCTSYIATEWGDAIKKVQVGEEHRPTFDRQKRRKRGDDAGDLAKTSKTQSRLGHRLKRTSAAKGMEWITLFRFGRILLYISAKRWKGYGRMRKIGPRGGVTNRNGASKTMPNNSRKKREKGVRGKTKMRLMAS